MLFGTSTDLPEVNAYTFGLAHIPTSQMVWSRVGQAPNRFGEGGRTVRRGTILEGPLKFAVSDLDPAALDLRKRPSQGLLGVMDGGQSTPNMVHLRRVACAALGVACIPGCERDFSTPWIPTQPDSVAVVAQRPDTVDAKPHPVQDSLPVKPRAILIESLSASDLRLQVGEIHPAPVLVLPANATAPLYEMTSSRPGVAEVTPDGIRGAGKGTATLTVHALDGSEKTASFHVAVDAALDICRLSCQCTGAGKGKGNQAKGGCAD